MTPSHQHDHPEDSSQSANSRVRLAALVVCLGLVSFGVDWNDPAFADEHAYISQSYYFDLFFAGDGDDRAWLDLPAYDLQPIPKYLIGGAMRLANLAMPNARDASEWYRNYKSFGTATTLIIARIPIVLLGTLGCLAIFACGTLLKDEYTGLIAAVVLMLNPLYRLHAHCAHVGRSLRGFHDLGPGICSLELSADRVE